MRKTTFLLPFFLLLASFTLSGCAGGLGIVLALLLQDDDSDRDAPKTEPLNPPVFVSISPSSGPELGTEVRIEGEGITADTVVMVCGTELCDASLDLVSQQITGVLPPGSGLCDVTLVSRGGSSVEGVDAFTYELPGITSIFPSSGPEAGGTVLAIGGEFFITVATALETEIRCDSMSEVLPSEAFVDLGVLTNVEIDSDEIRGTTPAGCGSVNVTVRNPETGSEALLIDAFEYLPPVILDVQPRKGALEGGTEVTITGENFGEMTDFFFCDSAVTVTDFNDLGDGMHVVTGVTTPGGSAGPCTVSAVNGSCPPVLFEAGVFTYFRRVAFFGTFSFNLDDAVAISPEPRGSSRMREFLDTKGFKVIPIGEEVLTADALSGFDALVFSVLQERDLTTDEAQIMSDFVHAGGGLVLLGELGIQNVGFKDAKNSVDRNLAAASFGISFRDDLLVDPSSHWLFNGCDDLICIEVGSDSSSPEGDPDNGQEHVVLRPEVSAHDLVTGVEAILLSWGQSLAVDDLDTLDFFLEAGAQSYGDVDPVHNPGEGACEIDWFENSEGPDDHLPTGVGMTALVALEDVGRVVALGDQDMFWNQNWIRSGTTGDPDACDEFLFSHDKLIRNILTWATGE